MPLISASGTWNALASTPLIPPPGAIKTGDLGLGTRDASDFLLYSVFYILSLRLSPFPIPESRLPTEAA
jgi:hypothetical protein